MELKTVLAKVASQMGYTELRPKQEEVLRTREWCFRKSPHRERQVRLLQLCMKAQNFWDSSRSSAYFDVRVFNSHAPSNCKTSTAACYRKHELEKRRAYERRILEVEHGSFTPIVLSTSGGWGPSATVAFRRLAGLLSVKHTQPYSTTLGFMRCKIAFSLLDSTIMCLRGARSSFHSPAYNTIGGQDQPFDLIASEARLSDWLHLTDN